MYVSFNLFFDVLNRFRPRATWGWHLLQYFNAVIEKLHFAHNSITRSTSGTGFTAICLVLWSTQIFFTQLNGSSITPPWFEMQCVVSASWSLQIKGDALVGAFPGPVLIEIPGRVVPPPSIEGYVGVYWTGKLPRGILVAGRQVAPPLPGLEPRGGPSPNVYKVIFLSWHTLRIPYIVDSCPYSFSVPTFSYIYIFHFHQYWAFTEGLSGTLGGQSVRETSHRTLFNHFRPFLKY